MWHGQKEESVCPVSKAGAVGPISPSPDLDSFPHLDAPGGMELTECGPQFSLGQSGCKSVRMGILTGL